MNKNNNEKVISISMDWSGDEIFRGDFWILVNALSVSK